MAWLRQHGFLIALTICFVSGVVAHRPLAAWAEMAWLRDGVIALCMLLMALPLEAQAIGAALRRPTATILAVLVSFGVLPLVAWCCGPLLPPEYAGGLLVAAVTPCTMASATVWTRRAGGNAVVATVVTVVTNMACFVVTPAWLACLLGTQGASPGDSGEMILRLALTVVCPVLLAQGLRRFSLVAAIAQRRRAFLSNLAQACVLWMVVLGAVKTGARLSEQPLSGSAVGSFAVMLLLVLGLHLAMFWLGLTLARLSGLTRADQLAVGFAGSQKTLLVGMNVSLHQGFSVLPMISWHVGQLFLDTFLADRLRRPDDESL